MLIIVDCEMGNLGSIFNMLKKIGVESKISKNPEEIDSAEKLILAGVGSFDSAMKKLAEMQLIPVLNKKALVDKIPVLGICLGMQLMTKGSEEGIIDGLSWFDARTVRFQTSSIKIPHMGWNEIRIVKEHRLFNSLTDRSRFYFIHSYHVICNNEEDILAATSYGGEFTSVINRHNIFGVQFHPEKSHRFGMQMLKNFIEL